jgi:hypothetical protein
VSGRVHGNELRVARGDGIPVANRRPLDRPFGVALGPGTLQKASDAESLVQRRRTRGVVDMRVRDQHLMERRSGERVVDAIEVSSFTGPGVDQRRDPAWKEPRPVAVAVIGPGLKANTGTAFKRTPSVERKRSRDA